MTQPTRYDQTPSGCWAACIAGLTGLPHDELAAFVPRNDDGSLDGSMGTEYHNAVNAYLRSRGWRLLHVGANAPRGFAIGSGDSPRDVSHAVIVRDGELWHDPHPSRAGVRSFEMFELLVPLVAPDATAWDDLRRLAPACADYAESRRAAVSVSQEGTND